MEVIQKKMSILLAGLLNGLSIFPSSHNSVSHILGSLKNNYELANDDGFKKDAERLYGDWFIVKNDIASSFNNLENDLPK